MWESHVSGCQLLASRLVKAHRTPSNAEALFNLRIVVDVFVVVKIDELVAEGLAEDESDRQQKPRAYGRRRRTGRRAIMRRVSGLCVPSSAHEISVRSSRRFCTDPPPGQQLGHQPCGGRIATGRTGRGDELDHVGPHQPAPRLRRQRPDHLHRLPPR